MTRTLEDLRQKIADTERLINTHKHLLDVLINERDAMVSKNVIASLGITSSDVHRPGFEHEDFFAYGDWLRKSLAAGNKLPRFVAWNGMIIMTSDALSGLLRHTGARMDDLEMKEVPF